MATIATQGARKFDFGARFDEPVKAPNAPEPPKYSDAEIAAARAEGYTEGRTEGMLAAKAEAEATIAAHAAKALERAGAGIAELLSDRARMHQDLAAQSVQTVMSVVARAMPELARRNTLVEVEGLIRTCLSELYDEPRVVIRACDPIIDALQKDIDRIAASCGFTGKIALFGDPEMAPTDCRVEWADGGAERNFEDTWRAIEAAMERGLNTNHGPTDRS
jgi:flagellar assembly protein FliH